MLTFGMTSLAGAALQISVDGYKNPLDSEIILMPSDNVILDVWTDTDIQIFEMFDYALIVADGPGSIDATSAVSLYGCIMATDIPNEHYLIGPGVAAHYLAGLSDNPVAGDTFLVDTIFHCDGLGDIVVELWSLELIDDNMFAADYLMDSVVIHSCGIPEPMTLAFLGLGGFFMRGLGKKFGPIR
jgi:hypothetical protein